LSPGIDSINVDFPRDCDPTTNNFGILNGIRLGKKC
jgi:hypothetical protein